jgi:hypothetical protein
VRHFTRHYCNVIINSHNGQLWLSHRFTCFIQWRSTAGVMDNIGRQIQTPVQ